MTVPDRAERAARALRDQSARRVDPYAARAALHADAPRRRRDRTGRIAAGGLAVVALVGIVLVGAMGPGGDPSPDGKNRTRTDEYSEKDRSVLDNMPASAIDGKASWRLPVTADPRDQLHDGDRIRVYGRGFPAGASVGLVQCSSEADVGGAGVAACDLNGPPEAQQAGSFSTVTYATADARGQVVADYRVRRFIDTPDGGRVDCRSAAERCLVAIGAISNYDQSGGTYVNFADAPPFPQPTFTLDPAQPAPGMPVRATVTGWMPGRPVRLEQCQGEACQTIVDGTADAFGAFEATVVLPSAVIDRTKASSDPVVCIDCVLRATGIGPAGATSAPFPDPIPLAFAEKPFVTVPPPAPTTTTTTVSAPTPGGDPGSDPGTGGGPVTTVPASTDTPPDQSIPPPLLPGGRGGPVTTERTESAGD